MDGTGLLRVKRQRVSTREKIKVDPPSDNDSEANINNLVIGRTKLCDFVSQFNCVTTPNIVLRCRSLKFSFAQCKPPFQTSLSPITNKQFSIQVSIVL